MTAYLIILFTVLVVLAALGRTIRIVPQARAYIVERLGSYNRTLSAGSTPSCRAWIGYAAGSTCANRWCPSRRSR
jgi:regulator of protease activity HflC (stomatin/prohibitin superfamily)